MATTLTTDRLLLRHWRDEDRAPFAAINADPRVMEHFPAPLSRLESDALIDEFERRFDPRGFGLWALERRDIGERRHVLYRMDRERWVAARGDRLRTGPGST